MHVCILLYLLIILLSMIVQVLHVSNCLCIFDCRVRHQGVIGASVSPQQQLGSNQLYEPFEQEVQIRNDQI